MSVKGLAQEHNPMSLAIPSHPVVLWACHAIFLPNEHLVKHRAIYVAQSQGTSQSRQKTLDPEKFCMRLQWLLAWPFNMCISITTIFKSLLISARTFRALLKEGNVCVHTQISFWLVSLKCWNLEERLLVCKPRQKTAAFKD